jgi:hypothetical protein
MNPGFNEFIQQPGAPSTILPMQAVAAYKGLVSLHLHLATPLGAWDTWSSLQLELAHRRNSQFQLVYNLNR